MRSVHISSRMYCVCGVRFLLHIPAQFFQTTNIFPEPATAAISWRTKVEIVTVHCRKTNAWNFVVYSRLSLSLSHECECFPTLGFLAPAREHTHLCRHWNVSMWYRHLRERVRYVSARSRPSSCIEMDRKTSDLHHVLITRMLGCTFGLPHKSNTRRGKCLSAMRNCCRMDAVDGASAHLRYYFCSHSRLCGTLLPEHQRRMCSLQFDCYIVIFVKQSEKCGAHDMRWILNFFKQWIPAHEFISTGCARRAGVCVRWTHTHSNTRCH